MRVPLSWLAERVELRGDAHAICDALTGAGVEAEVVSDERRAWPLVVTATLRSVDRIEGSDHLTVTRVWDGTEERQVVCGAPNHRAGDVVALALPGAILPGDFKIKVGKKLGVESHGMLCSTAELGLPGDADGILILPAGTPLGAPLHDVLPQGDAVIELSLTANRGDCLSILGVARELAAVTGWPLRRPAEAMSGAHTQPSMPALSPGNSVRVGHDQPVSLRVEDAVGCPRYCGAILAGVRVAPSPDWLRERLEAVGLRSVNNVVDCTNYVMWELGNPLHAFDRRGIRGDRVVARRAEAGERLRTLDGTDVDLVETDLVIADGDGPTALAGIMGGELSEVKDDTTVLFLEAAHFDPAPVRATQQRTGLRTDSSQRFARGVDPELPRLAMQRLVALLQQTAGGELDGGIAEVAPTPGRRPTVSLRLARLEGLLGLTLPAERVTELLGRVGCEAPGGGPLVARDGEVLARAPSHRFDLEREVDLLEEIVRLHGFDGLPERAPTGALTPVAHDPGGPDLRAVRTALLAEGLSEAVHYSFIDPTWLEALGLPPDDERRAGALQIVNPLSEVGGVLRTILLPSLLRAVARNRAVGHPDVRLFEVRRTFRRGGQDSPADERRTVAGVLCGRRHPPGWAWSDEAVDFADLAAAAGAVERALQPRGVAWTRDALPPFLDPQEGAVLRTLGRPVEVGWMGRVAADVLRRFELDAPVYAFELDLDRLAPARRPVPKLAAWSRFPAATRDLAIIARDDRLAADLLKAADKAGKKAAAAIFQGVSVFDVYRGAGIPEGHRSLALRLSFRALDRTLADAEVDAATAAVGTALRQVDGVAARQ